MIVLLRSAALTMSTMLLTSCRIMKLLSYVYQLDVWMDDARLHTHCQISQSGACLFCYTARSCLCQPPDFIGCHGYSGEKRESSGISGECELRRAYSVEKAVLFSAALFRQPVAGSRWLSLEYSIYSVGCSVFEICLASHEFPLPKLT